MDSELKRKMMESNKDTEEPNKTLKMTKGSYGTYSSDACYSSGEDSEFEGNYVANEIVVSNLSQDITEHDIEKFFEGTGEPRVGVVCVYDNATGKAYKYVKEDEYEEYEEYEESDEESDEESVEESDEETDEEKDDLRCTVTFDSDADTKAALAMNGNDLLGCPLRIKRVSACRKVICITGFKSYLSTDLIKEQIITQLKSCGKVLKIFLPIESVGLAYVYMDCNGIQGLDDKLINLDLRIDGATIDLCPVPLKTEVCRAKMVVDENEPPEIERLSGGEEISYLKKENLLYLANFEKFLETAWDVPADSGEFQMTFTWREERPAILPVPANQTKNNCFAIALSSGYNTAVKIKSLERDVLTADMIEYGVGARYLFSGSGLDRMSHAVPIMKLYCEDMVIHRRPRGDVYEDYEDFEIFIISLLKKGPVAVVVDMPPSLLGFDGKGVYHPDAYDLIRKAHEVVFKHVLLLSGLGVQVFGERRRDFWQFQESKSEEYGDAGYVMMARHQCLIKQAIEIKV